MRSRLPIPFFTATMLYPLSSPYRIIPQPGGTVYWDHGVGRPWCAVGMLDDGDPRGIRDVEARRIISVVLNAIDPLTVEIHAARVDARLARRDQPVQRRARHAHHAVVQACAC